MSTCTCGAPLIRPAVGRPPEFCAECRRKRFNARQAGIQRRRRERRKVRLAVELTAPVSEVYAHIEAVGGVALEDVERLYGRNPEHLLLQLEVQGYLLAEDDDGRLTAYGRVKE